MRLLPEVRRVDVALRVDGQRLHAVELPRLGSGGAPLPDELAVLVELGDAVGGAHAVGDVDVAGAIPRHVGRLAERGPGNPRSWRRRGPARPGTRAGRGGRRPTGRRAGGRRRRRTHVDDFRLPAEHQHDAALGIELHHLVGRLVDGPDVVLRIDAQAEGGIEAVDVLPQLADELAAGVELEQPRAAAIERAVVAQRGVGVTGARVDEDAALRVAADAGHLAEVDVGRACAAGRRWRRRPARVR